MKKWAGTLAGTLIVVFALGVLPLPSSAAEPGVTPPRQNWSFEGIFGTYDRGELQRGFMVYKQVCAACHSMDKLYYRHLEALGYNDPEVRAIASQYVVMDGPDDMGEMFERPGLPSDRFVRPYPNAQAAAFANNGAVPPDLSLINYARYGGADYIYAFLTGYEDPPADVELMQGQYWNLYMPGHIVAMAPPLVDGLIPYEDGTEETVSQYAHDMAVFLQWASDPHMEVRKQTGIKVFLFLFIFTGIMYAVKRKLWAKVH